MTETAARARTCARDDCTREVPSHWLTNMCAPHWRVANGFLERGSGRQFDSDTGKWVEDADAVPDPPTGESHTGDPLPPPRQRPYDISDACVLCGSTDVQRRNQLGRPRGAKRFVRQLGGVLPGVPFVTGPRCDDCDLGVRGHGDRVHPILAYVMAALGRTDLDVEADIWAGIVLAARAAGGQDPSPPAEPWGFTRRGPGVDLDALPDPDRLSADEVTRLRELLGAAASTSDPDLPAAGQHA